MKHSRRQLALLATLSLAFATATNALAQTWPAKPVTLVVPYPPGGNADNVGRWIGWHLSRTLGQPVVVDNRAGAGALIGIQAVAAAKADGYTFLLTPFAALTLTPHLRKGSSDLAASFDPVASISSTYGLVTANKGLPANNMAELVTLAKKQPGRLTYGSSGMGTATHLYGEMLNRKAQIDLLHVPYKGSSAALTDLTGGRIDVMFDPALIAQVRTGAVKALAAQSPRRHPELPGVPTLAEQGLDIGGPKWIGIVAPRGTPREFILKMSSAIQRATADKASEAELLRYGQYPDFHGPDDFARMIKADSAFFRSLVSELKITAE